ncbi:MAG: tRNA pseudouridine(38-40) synthase TruA [Bacteroidales bacterium]|jgi:tRNA pseudouridine38-40 synthase
MITYRYFIHLAYNGSPFHGWQVQENAPSVQGVITHALQSILHQEINLVGCGRTDTGVHARDYYAHFDLEEGKTKDELDNLAYRLNRFLKDDIVIFRIFPVPQHLHARFSAHTRTYEYHIHTRKDPFLQEYSWYVHPEPDIARMNKGANLLLKTDDFTSFSKLHSAAKTNICKVTYAQWDQSGHRIIFSITADRFLRNMVRAIVGTLVDLGHGKISLEDLQKIIEGKDRSLAGESVPAKGLFLSRVVYPQQLSGDLEI